MSMSTSERADLSLLKKKARCVEDIQQWLYSNITVFGLPAASNTVRYVVEYDPMLHALFDRDVGTTFNTKMTVRSTTYHVVPKDARDELHVSSAIEINQAMSIDMHLSLAEWPFLVAKLAGMHLMMFQDDYYDVVYRDRIQVMDHYLAKHFPAFNRKAVENMAMAGLISPRFPNDILPQSLVDLVFYSRTDSIAPPATIATFGDGP